jgi:hypothetical protein
MSVTMAKTTLKGRSINKFLHFQSTQQILPRKTARPAYLSQLIAKTAE